MNGFCLDIKYENACPHYLTPYLLRQIRTRPRSRIMYWQRVDFPSIRWSRCILRTIRIQIPGRGRQARTKCQLGRLAVLVAHQLVLDSGKKVNGDHCGVAFVHSTLLFAWYRCEWQCAPIRFGTAKMLCTGAWSALSDDVPSPVSALKILVQSPDSKVIHSSAWKKPVAEKAIHVQ